MIKHHNVRAALSSVLAAVTILTFAMNKPKDVNIETKAEEQSSSISIKDINSDIKYETEELSFGDIASSTIENDWSFQGRTASSEVTPLYEKIATDWVEPEIVPVSPKKKEPRVIDVRTYTTEEIAANALTPFKVPQDDWRTTYYTWNMIDAMTTPHLDGYDNEDAVFEMGRIIHAEICTLGDEARRCVGTVLVNRMWNQGKSLTQVIYAPHQFDTAYTTKVPCDSCLAAAYDILYNDYRSFPHYVDSFQSNWDGYFSGHATYIAFDDGHYDTWFSYRKKAPMYVLQ